MCNLHHQKVCLDYNKKHSTEWCTCIKVPFYQKYSCPNCHKTIEKCKCKINYCPFCNAKFGFVQDWNIHLRDNHVCCERVFTNKHAWSNHRRSHKITKTTDGENNE